MASEVIDETIRFGEGVVFKIDFEKVYDYVDWDFLGFILYKMDFSERWIRKCVTCP